MTKPKRPLTSMFRLPRIPIKNLFKADTRGFISYSLTKRDKSWEAKDSTGCQLFWIELETEKDTGSLAELLGIFGEQIAVLRRESPVSNKYALAFTNTVDAPDFSSVTLSFTGPTPHQSVAISIISKETGTKHDFTWENSESGWSLHLAGTSQPQGTFERVSDDKATVNFLEDTPPEELAVLAFAITFTAYSST